MLLYLLRATLLTPPGKLSDFTIFERITMNWSPGFSFIWSNGGRRLNLVSDESDTYDQLEDISVVMRDRALRGLVTRCLMVGAVTLFSAPFTEKR